MTSALDLGRLDVRDVEFVSLAVGLRLGAVAKKGVFGNTEGIYLLNVDGPLSLAWVSTTEASGDVNTLSFSSDGMFMAVGQDDSTADDPLAGLVLPSVLLFERGF